MDLDSLSVRQFRYLSTVATHPTFTDAAAELGISQSALSQAMQRIEKLVGVPLFVPDGRMRRLTEVGAVMVARSRQIVGVSAALENEVTAHGHGEVGRLRVGMIDAAALYLRPDSVTRLKTTHPDAAISVIVSSSGRLIDRVVEHDLDVAIVVGPVPTQLVAIAVTKEALNIYRGGDTIEGPWVLYPQTSQTRAAIDAGLLDRGISPHVIAESSNPSVLSRLAAIEGAATVLPEVVAQDEAGLTHLGPLTTRSIAVVHRRNDTPPLVMQFINEVVGSS